MPKRRPGVMHYVDEASADVRHGAPVAEDSFVGVAVKQVEPSITGAFENRDLIAEEEAFAMIVKGEVEVDTVAEAAVGDAIYIDAENKLTKTAEGNTAYGRVTTLAGERGCPTGKMRVDLDAKDSV